MLLTKDYGAYGSGEYNNAALKSKKQIDFGFRNADFGFRVHDVENWTLPGSSPS